MRTFYKKLVDAVSATTNPVSSAMLVENISNFSVTAVCSSTASGTAKLQVHNALSPAGDGSDLTSGEWVDMAGSSATVSSTAQVWNVANSGYRWVRISYTNSSGTGNLTAYATGKAATG